MLTALSALLRDEDFSAHIDSMSDTADSHDAEPIEVKRARLADQAAAIERELAELEQLERLAAKHKYLLIPPKVAESTPAVNETAPSARAPDVAPNVMLASTAILKTPLAFDSGPITTLRSLVEVYRQHPSSPYQGLTFKVRANYDGLLSRLLNEMGSWRLGDFDKEKIEAVYNGWTSAGKLYMAHALVGMFRQLCNFGMTVLEDANCGRLSMIVRTMRFKAPVKKSFESLTDDHVAAIREEAHKADWHSIALAQVIQYELKLRQLDVIGEWLPVSAAGESDIALGDERWTRGLRWSQINKDLILHHVTSNRLEKPKEFYFDLKRFPSIMEELDWVGKIPADGPMIICEPTGLPYSTAEFRRKWRIVATKAGIPTSIKNADSLHDEIVEDKPKEVRLVVERRTGPLN
jgi:hypothetical protein